MRSPLELNSMSLNPKTERRISQCIDEVVLEMLGKNGKQTVARHLLESVGLKMEEVPLKPESFREGLEQIFGEEGAEFLETQIVKKLQENLGLQSKSKLTLVETIQIIKKQGNSF